MCFHRSHRFREGRTMNYARRLSYLLVTVYLYVWIPCPASAFLRAGVEHWTAPRPRKKGCKHAARSPLPSTPSMVAAVTKVTTREGDVERKEITERKSMASRLEDLKVGDRLKGIVVNELEGETGKKAWVRVGVTRYTKGGGTAFVDGMIRVDEQKGVKPTRMAVDKPVTVYVSKVITAEGRLEVSLRPPKPRRPVVDTSNLRPLSNLAVGDELQGVVKTVTHFAAFVSCGVGRPTRRLRPDGKPAVMEEVDGFLGEDDVPEGMALSAKLVKKEGTRVIIGEGNLLKVFVKAVHPSNGRFRLTLDPDVTKENVRRMRNAGTRASSRFSKRKEAEDLATGEDILGDIIKVSEYGFFVDVGAKINGLVHISSISEKEDRYLGNLKDFAREGDRMYVRVNGLDEKGRLSLSYVSRERDRSKPPNRRERRAAAAAAAKEGPTTSVAPGGTITDNIREVDDDLEDEEDDGGGFLFDSPPRRGDVGEDDDGYASNLDYDIFDDM